MLIEVMYLPQRHEGHKVILLVCLAALWENALRYKWA